VSKVSAAEVRMFVLLELADALAARGLEPRAVPDSFDLLTEGVIDSLGIVEVIAALEQRFLAQIDFEELDPEDMTIIGPLSRYVAAKATATEPIGGS
jgi:acyl carrier protein